MKKTGLFRAAALLLALCLLPPAVAETDTARVWAVDQNALVSETGEVIIPEGEYAEIRAVREDLFAARNIEDDGWLLLNAVGEVAAEGPFEDVYGADDWIVFRQGGFWGAMDAGLETVYEAQFTQLVPTGAGGFLALRSDPEDDNGDGVYRLDGKGGMETTGTLTVYGLGEFSCGLCPATSAGKKRYGYLDADGVWAISAQYGYALAFAECGLAVASVDSGVGLIDTEGNWALSPRYETVALSKGNVLAAASTGTGRIILYDAEAGRKVADLSGSGSAYARTERLRDMALVTIDGTVTLYGRDGEAITSWNAEEGATICSAGKDALIKRTEEGDWLLSASGEILAGSSGRIHCLDDGLFSCEGEDGCALIDAAGETVLQTRYASVLRAMPGLYLAKGGPEGVVLIDREGAVRAVIAPADEIEDGVS